MAAYYELISDTLMDLTHVEFVHEGILGSDAIKPSRTYEWKWGNRSAIGYFRQLRDVLLRLYLADVRLFNGGVFSRKRFIAISAHANYGNLPIIVDINGCNHNYLGGRLVEN